MRNKTNNKNKSMKAYATASFSEAEKRLPDSKLKIPGEQSVLDAKEFVDANKK